eukprot:15162407-Heterocapsa_arctica.AAC.1
MKIPGEPRVANFWESLKTDGFRKIIFAPKGWFGLVQWAPCFRCHGDSPRSSILTFLAWQNARAA